MTHGHAAAAQDDAPNPARRRVARPSLAELIDISRRSIRLASARQVTASQAEMIAAAPGPAFTPACASLPVKGNSVMPEQAAIRPLPASTPPPHAHIPAVPPRPAVPTRLGSTRGPNQGPAGPVMAVVAG